MRDLISAWGHVIHRAGNVLTPWDDVFWADERAQEKFQREVLHVAGLNERDISNIEWSDSPLRKLVFDVQKTHWNPQEPGESTETEYTVAFQWLLKTGIVMGFLQVGSKSVGRQAIRQTDARSLGYLMTQLVKKYAPRPKFFGHDSPSLVFASTLPQSWLSRKEPTDESERSQALTESDRTEIPTGIESSSKAPSLQDTAPNEYFTER